MAAGQFISFGIGSPASLRAWLLLGLASSVDPEVFSSARPLSSGYMPAPRARALPVVAQHLSGATFDRLARGEADGAGVWAVRDARTRQISVQVSHLGSL